MKKVNKKTFRLGYGAVFAYICAVEREKIRYTYYKPYHQLIMTKAEIVKSVAQSTGIEKETVATAIESIMETIKGSLTQGEPVYLRGFGTFFQFAFHYQYMFR